MKNLYAIVLTPEQNGYTVYCPALNINTEGESLEDAIDMARDAIGLAGISMQDLGQKIPDSSIEAPQVKGDEIVTLVDIDFAEYRRANDLRSVKKNCTLPAWLNYKAEQAGINFSAVLQKGLKAELSIPD